MYSIYADLRDKMGLSDYSVAKKIGVGRSTLSDWKTGKHIPNRDNLKKIADFFNVTLDYLMTGRTADNSSNDVLKEKAAELYGLYEKATPEVQQAVEILLRSAQ